MKTWIAIILTIAVMGFLATIYSGVDEQSSPAEKAGNQMAILTHP